MNLFLMNILKVTNCSTTEHAILKWLHYYKWLGNAVTSNSLNTIIPENQTSVTYASVHYTRPFNSTNFNKHHCWPRHV